jgi:hypothetical protein
VFSPDPSARRRLARAPLNINSVIRTKVHSTTKATVMNMKASRLFKSFQALPQDPDKSRAERDRPEANAPQSCAQPNAEPEFKPPPEDGAVARPPLRWGINE